MQEEGSVTPFRHHNHQFNTLYDSPPSSSYGSIPFHLPAKSPGEELAEEDGWVYAAPCEEEFPRIPTPPLPHSHHDHGDDYGASSSSSSGNNSFNHSYHAGETGLGSSPGGRGMGKEGQWEGGEEGRGRREGERLLSHDGDNTTLLLPDYSASSSSLSSTDPSSHSHSHRDRIIRKTILPWWLIGFALFTFFGLVMLHLRLEHQYDLSNMPPEEMDIITGRIFQNIQPRIQAELDSFTADFDSMDKTRSPTLSDVAKAEIRREVDRQLTNVRGMCTAGVNDAVNAQVELLKADLVERTLARATAIAKDAQTAHATALVDATNELAEHARVAIEEQVQSEVELVKSAHAEALEEARATARNAIKALDTKPVIPNITEMVEEVETGLSSRLDGRIEELAGLIADRIALLTRQHEERDAETVRDLRAQFELLKSDIQERTHNLAPTIKTAQETMAALEILMKETEKMVEGVRGEAEKALSVATNTAGSVDKVVRDGENMLAEERQRIRDERSGEVDYALMATGGRVVLSSPTHTVNIRPAKILGVVDPCWLWNCVVQPRSATEMIKADVEVGSCWPMAGSRGFAVIRLSERIKLSSVSLEHVSKTATPDISTTPKRFAISGVRDEDVRKDRPVSREIALTPPSSFTYDYNVDRKKQTFNLTTSEESFQYVKFTVLENYGNPNYTCVYRLRVHGSKSSSSPSSSSVSSHLNPARVHHPHLPLQTEL